MAPQGTTLDRRETANLIGSDKVQGTPVYRSNGERVGTIDRVMIDKLSGKGAPKYSKHDTWDWSDRARDRKVYAYYDVTPFWGS